MGASWRRASVVGRSSAGAVTLSEVSCGRWCAARSGRDDPRVKQLLKAAIEWANAGLAYSDLAQAEVHGRGEEVSSRKRRRPDATHRALAVALDAKGNYVDQNGCDPLVVEDAPDDEGKDSNEGGIDPLRHQGRLQAPQGAAGGGGEERRAARAAHRRGRLPGIAGRRPDIKNDVAPLQEQTESEAISNAVTTLNSAARCGGPPCTPDPRSRCRKRQAASGVRLPS